MVLFTKNRKCKISRTLWRHNLRPILLLRFSVKRATESLNWLNFCLSRAIIITNNALFDYFDSRRLFVGFMSIISSIESFILSIKVFKKLAENCKKKYFLPFKSKVSNKESSDNFYSLESFEGFIIRINTAIEKKMAKPNGFGQI